MPNNVSLAIAFKTGNIGRSRRGRNFWPLLAEADVSGCSISTVQIAAILSAYYALKALTESSELWLLSVISRQQNGVLLESGVCYPVTNFSVADNIVDSMKRRLPGRGV